MPQTSSERVGTKKPVGRSGPVTRAASLGMPLSGSANNQIGNRGASYGKKMNTRLIKTGTKPNGSRTGTVTRGVL